jgi:hypothetical protein
VTRVKQPGRGWAYIGVVGGGTVSIAANIAHSFLPPVGASADWSPEAGAVGFAVAWPVVLFIGVEIFIRTVWPTGWGYHLVRWAGLLPVAGVAALVSYKHLSGLLAHYGEEPIVCIVGPLAIDGLMIMATGAIKAGGRAARITAHGLTPSTPAPSVLTPPVPATPAPAVVPSVVLSPHAAPDPGAPPVPAPAPVPAPTPTAVATRAKARQVTGTPKPTPARTAPDTSVTTAEPARRKQNVTPGQLARARHTAAAYQKETGTDINAGELAVRMRCSTEQASRLLAALNQAEPSTPTRDENRNGNPAPALLP